jgi:hypothetical protein
MIMQPKPFYVVVAGAIIGGCIVSSKPPTIAHIHIGHAITAFEPTPNHRSLLATAEAEAAVVVENAELAADSRADLNRVKTHARAVVHALDPTREKAGPGPGFGFMRAIEGTGAHVVFAAESADSSNNVRQSVDEVSARAKALASQAQLMLAIASDIEKTNRASDAAGLAEELRTLARANLAARPDSRLQQLRAQIIQMAERENPPYTAVETWYLFNLIRLPNGDWAFRGKPPAH